MSLANRVVTISKEATTVIKWAEFVAVMHWSVWLGTPEVNL